MDMNLNYISLPTDNWLNDIALLRLEEELPEDEDPNLSTIELPQNSEGKWPESDEQCVMNGWGCVSYGKDLDKK